MISPDKHTVNSVHAEKAFILANIIATVLFASIFLGGKSLSNAGLRDIDSSGDRFVYVGQTNSSTTFDNLPLHSIPSHPRGGVHEENMVEPESLQDDDASEELLLIAGPRVDHSIQEGRMLLSSGSLAIRPTISLIILHHSWKMHLS